MKKDAIQKYIEMPDGIVVNSNDKKSPLREETTNYEEKAIYLINNGYPVPTNNVSDLEKILREADAD